MSPLTLPEVEGLTPAEAALAYGSHGWPVFPCEAANHDPSKNSWAKRPHSMLRDEEAARGEGGWKLATTDADKIASWWDRDPEALIGVVPGMAGAVVLDADGAKGVKALFDVAKDFDLTSTAVSRTPGKGGGMHVWFDRRQHKGTVGNGSLRVIPGEARGDRGYVIVPPSRLPDGGEYRFEGHTAEVMALPQWAKDVLPWETAATQGALRASIADVTKGDEMEWLLSHSVEESDEDAKAFLAEGIRRIAGAPKGDQQEGRHPTATRVAASLLSKAQRGEFQINLPEALGQVRAALLSVKPGGGGDFDRFVSDAIALRVSEDEQRKASVVDISQLRRTEIVEDESVWQDPEEISPRRRPGTHTPFPTDVLPDVMHRAVVEVAKATQVADVLPAMAAFGAASAATANGFVVSLDHSWEEGLSLYLIGVADPSERKTATLKPFIDSIRYATAEWTQRTAKRRAEWEAEGHSIEARLKEAKKNVATPEGKKELADLTVIAEGWEKEGHELTIPNGLIHSDPTQEALAAKMAEQHGTAFVASSEGAFIANLAGRYSNRDRNDLSLVNEAYSRSFTRVTRVTRGDITVPVPHLAMVSFIQPRVAGQLAHPDFEGTGFLSRVLYAQPPSRVGERQATLSRYSPFYSIALDAWRDRMVEIFERGWTREEDPVHMSLEPEAVEVFEPWWRLCERMTPKSPWWGKAHGNAVRLAAIMALVENPYATRVSATWMAAAIQIMEFFVNEQIVMRESILDGTATAAEDDKEAARAVRAIAKRWETVEKSDGVIRQRDLCRWLRRNTAEAMQVADILVERGWFKEIDAGRSDSRAFSPNPRLPEMVAAMQESERVPSVVTSVDDAPQEKSEVANTGVSAPETENPSAPEELEKEPAPVTRVTDPDPSLAPETPPATDWQKMFDGAVDKMLAEPDVAKSLASLAPKQTEVPEGLEGTRDTYRKTGVARCPECEKRMGGMPSGNFRCVEHGEFDYEDVTGTERGEGFG